jgi:serine/threonine protein kinase
MHDKKTTIKQYRAVKILSKAYMEDKHIKEFYNEIAVHKKIGDHPCIMTLYHWFEDQKRFMIITEISTGGELLDLM